MNKAKEYTKKKYIDLGLNTEDQQTCSRCEQLLYITKFDVYNDNQLYPICKTCTFAYPIRNINEYFNIDLHPFDHKICPCCNKIKYNCYFKVHDIDLKLLNPICVDCVDEKFRYKKPDKWDIVWRNFYIKKKELQKKLIEKH